LIIKNFKFKKKYFKVNDANKYLNILRGPNVSLVKKRQLMNSLFGDYRAKMKQEQTKTDSNRTSLVKLTTDQSKLEKLSKNSKFIRNSSRKDSNNNIQIENLTLTDENKKFIMKPQNQNVFKFDFNTDENKEI
jgi:hypothetical protein